MNKPDEKNRGLLSPSLALGGGALAVARSLDKKYNGGDVSGLVSDSVGHVLKTGLEIAIPTAHAGPADYVADTDTITAKYGITLPASAGGDWLNVWGSAGDPSFPIGVDSDGDGEADAVVPYFVGVDSDGDNWPDQVHMTTDGSSWTDVSADFASYPVAYPSSYSRTQDALLVNEGEYIVGTGYGDFGALSGSLLVTANGNSDGSIDDATGIVYGTDLVAGTQTPAIFDFSGGISYPTALDTVYEEVALPCDTNSGVCAFTDNSTNEVVILNISTGDTYPTGSFGGVGNFQPASGPYGNRFTITDYDTFEQYELEDPTTIDLGDGGGTDTGDGGGDTGTEDTGDTGEPVDTGDTGEEVPSDDLDGDGVLSKVDCDDNDPGVGAEVTYYRDSDGDGAGDPDVSTEACERPEGYVDNASDCNDTTSLMPDGNGDCSTESMEVADGVLVTPGVDGSMPEVVDNGDGSLSVTAEDGSTARVTVSDTSPYSVYFGGGDTFVEMGGGDVVDGGFGAYDGVLGDYSHIAPPPDDGSVDCSNECNEDGVQPDYVYCDAPSGEAQKSNLSDFHVLQGDVDVRGTMDWSGVQLPNGLTVSTSDRQACEPQEVDPGDSGDTGKIEDTGLVDSGGDANEDSGQAWQVQPDPTEGCSGGCNYSEATPGLMVGALAVVTALRRMRR